MKKIFKHSNAAVIVCVISIIILIVALGFVLFFYLQGSANLAKQQQWASSKDNFDKAYEIAAADRETPDKTLYVPKLLDQIGKTIDEAISNIGQGATIVSVDKNGNKQDKVQEQTVLNLTNESGDNKIGTPSVVLGTNSFGKITKISFSCSTWLLGYGPMSFIDMANNEHVIEKTFREAGLNVSDGTIVAPQNRAVYTTYASDGTTVEKECQTFNGFIVQDKVKYSWEARLNFDYTYANQKGNLADTVRIIFITIEK